MNFLARLTAAAAAEIHRHQHSREMLRHPIRLAVEHWIAAVEHPAFLSPAQIMRAMLSGGAPIGGNGMSRLSTPGGGGVGGGVVSAAAQPVTGSPSVSASGALSTAVQINSTEKTNAPVVNISSGYGSSISAPTASTEPTTAAISSLTWLNWLEIGAFALFGVWLMRRH